MINRRDAPSPAPTSGSCEIQTRTTNRKQITWSTIETRGLPAPRREIGMWKSGSFSRLPRDGARQTAIKMGNTLNFCAGINSRMIEVCPQQIQVRAVRLCGEAGNLYSVFEACWRVAPWWNIGRGRPKSLLQVLQNGQHALHLRPQGFHLLDQVPNFLFRGRGGAAIFPVFSRRSLDAGFSHGHRLTTPPTRRPAPHTKKRGRVAHYKSKKRGTGDFEVKEKTRPGNSKKKEGEKLKSSGRPLIWAQERI